MFHVYNQEWKSDTSVGCCLLEVALKWCDVADLGEGKAKLKGYVENWIDVQCVNDRRTAEVVEGSQGIIAGLAVPERCRICALTRASVQEPARSSENWDPLPCGADFLYTFEDLKLPGEAIDVSVLTGEVVVM
jgi:hypothetical protein